MTEPDGRLVRVFPKLRNGLGLANNFEAVQELSKGKRTTDRFHYTGEEIFFTSKAVDLFRLTSSGVRWTVDNLRSDTALGLIPEFAGTTVVCQLDPKTNRTLPGVFKEFTSDHSFVRTRPVVKLFEIGTVFVSRSEARRFLDGLDADFDTLEVDFSGVTDVGQGFVDELLRVWPAAHPSKTVIPANMNPAVNFMVQRGLSRIEPPDQEQVATVAVELGALVLMHGVLDRQRVQPEFVAQHRQVVAAGVTQVEPDGDRLIGQVITDLGHRETLKLEYSVPVEPRAGLALGRDDPRG